MTRARETSENARQAKAWVNFDGTFGSSPFTLANGGIRSAFNVSSVTDLGAGYYQVNFATAFSDSDWVMCGTAKFEAIGDNNIPNVGLSRTETTANAAATTHARIKIGFYSNGYSVYDAEIVMLAFFHND